MVTDQRREIAPQYEQGIFAADTRFVSQYRLYIEAQPWDLLTSAAVHHYTVQLQLVNPSVVTRDGEIPAQELGLSMSRLVGDGIHEDLEIASYARLPVRFQFEIDIRCDFADIFEVRGHRVRRRPISVRWNDQRRELVSTYTNRDFE